MKTKSLTISALLLCVVLISTAFAQPATGTPPFGSFLPTPGGTVNLGNLNLHLEIPVLQKAGRGTPFTYSILYDSSVWYPVTVNGVSTWQPVANIGWSADALPALGYLSYKSTQQRCLDDSDPGGKLKTVYYQVQRNFVYTDKFGQQHPFTNEYGYDPCDGIDFTIDNTRATDGSGYTLSGYTIGTAAGTSFNPPTVRGTAASGNYTDANGNQITLSNGKFYDTLSTTTPVLSVSGTAPNPTTLTYTPPSGAGSSAQYTINYITKNIRTAFGCSGIGEYTASNVPLVSSIGLPGNTLQYGFDYEKNSDGTYTGRLTQITLPTGGQISISYSGNSSGISNGIVCADGSTGGMTITTPDGTTTFTRTGSGTSWTTAVVDAVSNETDIAFTETSNNFYESSRTLYQGAASGGKVQETITTTRDSGGILPTGVKTALATGYHRDTGYYWSTYNQLLTQVDYDWSGGTGLGNPLRTTSFAYVNGNYLAAGFLNLISSIKVYDGTASGTLRSSTAYTYDQPGAITSCPSSVPNHDYTKYGCSSTTLRGLVTTQTQYTNLSTNPGTAPVTTTYTYDVFGNPLKTTVGTVLQSTAAYSSTTQYSQPDSITFGSGSTSLMYKYGYDANTNQLTSVTDPTNNKATTQTYDALLRPLVTTRADSKAITVAYDDTAHTVTTTTPFDGPTALTSTQYLDRLGRVKSVQSPTGAVDTQYDALGRVSEVSNPYASGDTPVYTTTAYDTLGRVTSVTAPDGAVSRLSYDPISGYGDPVVSTDPALHQKLSSYDGLGRLASVYEPDVNHGNSLTIPTSYTYTALGSLSSVSQGAQTRTFTYDGLNRLISASTPEGGTVQYTYDSCSNSPSNVCTRTDARGVVTSYTYDGLNRPYQVSYNVGSTGVQATPTVTYTYGGSQNSFNNGLLVGVTDGSHADAYTYDVMGNILSVAKTLTESIQQTHVQQTYSTQYAYNDAGLLKQLTYPSKTDTSGTALTYQYGSDGTLQSITDQNQKHLVSGLSYTPAGQVTGYNMGLTGGTVNVALGYNNRLQLTSLGYQANNNTLFSLGYGYNPATPPPPTGNTGNNGQILTIVDNLQSGRTATYTYDALNRLSSYVTNGSTAYPVQNMGWEYDRFGNRTKQTQNGNILTFSPSSTTNRLGGSTYDLNGNMTNDGSYSAKWDAENQMVSYGVTVTNEYDANGFRVRRTGSSSDTVYIFSGSQPLAEYAPGTAASSPNVEYVYLGSQLIASKTSAGYTFYARDHLSIRATLPDATPNNYVEMGHLPFGEAWYGESGNKWVFTNYERDPDVVDDYALARRYDYSWGRFSSPDPIMGDASDPQSWNRYTYVLNDPIDFTDPLGLYCYRGEGDGPMRGCTQGAAGMFGWGGGQFQQLPVFSVGWNAPTYYSYFQSPTGLWVFGVTTGGFGLKPIGTVMAGSLGGGVATYTTNSGGGNPANNGVTATISNDPNGKKNFCSHVADVAFWAAVLPGGEYLVGHDLTPETAAMAGITIAQDQLRDHAVDTVVKSTSFLTTVRSFFGVPKGVTAGAARWAGYIGLAWTAGKGTVAMQKAYKQCMEE